MERRENRREGPSGRNRQLLLGVPFQCFPYLSYLACSTVPIDIFVSKTQLVLATSIFLNIEILTVTLTYSRLPLEASRVIQLWCSTYLL